MMLFRGCRFSVNYCLAVVATLALMLLVERACGLKSSLAALLILPLLAAARVEGKAFARLNRNKPEGLACCSAALRMTAVSSILALALTWVAALLAPGTSTTLDLSPSDLFGLSVLVFALVAFPVARCGYAFGLASELRAQRMLRCIVEDI
jgi:hypothetical protein